MPIPPSGADRQRAGPIVLASAGFALAELLCGLSIGGFLAWGRIDPAPFLAVRPWLLLAAALLAGRFEWRRRLAFYALALPLAAAAEAAWLQGLGGPVPWPATARGLAIGAALAATIDLGLQAGRRWRHPAGTWLAAAAAAALIGAAFASSLPKGSPTTAAVSPGAPDLLLMTALPVVWGEGGAFDPSSRPAEAFRTLLSEYRVRPIDALDRTSLAGARLLLLAQPRWLEPAELVALDQWVRDGGRALILTDPALVWPSDLPPGDIRRPPPVGLLKPLLDHWGVRLEAAGGGPRTTFADGRKLIMDSPGRFAAASSACRVAAQPWLASCAPGRGRALLIADADLLRDDLWRQPGPFWLPGPERSADNPLLLADLLDRLAGLERQRFEPAIAWVRPGAPLGLALALALLPLLAAAGAGLLLGKGKRE